MESWSAGSSICGGLPPAIGADAAADVGSSMKNAEWKKGCRNLLRILKRWRRRKGLALSVYRNRKRLGKYGGKAWDMLQNRKFS